MAIELVAFYYFYRRTYIHTHIMTQAKRQPCFHSEASIEVSAINDEVYF